MTALNTHDAIAPSRRAFALHLAEMLLAMLAGMAVLGGALALGLLPESAVLAVQHVVMVPAMVGVMLWRYDHYAHRP